MSARFTPAGLAAALARLFARIVGRRPAEAFAWIDAPTLCERRRAGDEAVVIDVRGADEFAGELGHLEHARNIPLNELPQRIGELARLESREIVLVCKTQMRSAAAAATLRDAGFRNLAVLRGGMVEWNRQGFPVSRDPRSA